jgi:hypothetical protein
VSTPPFDKALSTFLLSARFAFLTSDLDIPCDVAEVSDPIEVAAGSLLCDQELMDVTTINAPLANLSVLIAFMSYLQVKRRSRLVD